MSHSDVVHRVLRAPRAALDWHDRRPRASLSSPRGWLWMALIAALLYWMSNPLVFIPSFFFSFEYAKLWTKIAILVTLPWLRLPRIPWPWLLFIALCYLSQLWSISDPNTDLSNLVYMQIALMAFIVAANCEPLVVCWGLGLGGVVVVVLSEYAYRQGMPGSSNGALRGWAFLGVGTNENILAYTLVVSLAATLAIGPPRRRIALATWVLVLASSGYGIYLAESGGGFVALLSVLLTAGGVAAWPSLRRRRSNALGVLAMAAGALVVGALAVTQLLGKDVLTMSDRAPFWRATVQVSLETAPWLGSGWGAVWEHPWNSAQPNNVAQLIYAEASYALPHGHNFFVDVVPELGVVGLTIALIMVGYSVFAIRRCGLRTGPDPTAGRLVLLVTVALLVNGITEPMLTVPLGWWAFALVVATARQRVLPRAPAAGRHTRSRSLQKSHNGASTARTDSVSASGPSS